MLKSCKYELTEIFVKLFQSSLDIHVVPSLWKTSKIVPVPKCNTPTEMNDLRPIALTSIVMKCFEKIVKMNLMKNVSSYCDGLQFAYKENRSVEDACATLLNNLYVHADKSNTYSRILFVDFSSAFNTIQPHIMLEKLLSMNVNPYIMLWINSYLTNRQQFVYADNVSSATIYTSTGAPQGCVLSPLLFTLYTNDCTSTRPESCTIIKYADDTVIIGNINENNESMYKVVVNTFVNWCDDNHLELNVKKTKEMVIDFRRNSTTKKPIHIKDEIVESVNKYKYLGMIIDSKLSGEENSQYVYLKAVKRVHFLNILYNLKVTNSILTLFYKSVIESVLRFNIVSYFGNAKQNDKNKLCKIVKKSKKLCISITPLTTLYDDAVLKLACKIMKDPTHPLFENYITLSSGRRLKYPLIKTNRMKNSFVPHSIKLCNSNKNQI